MTTPSPGSPDTAELIRRCVEGTASAADTAALRDTLRASPEARDLYIDYLRIHAMLRFPHTVQDAPEAANDTTPTAHTDRPLSAAGVPMYREGCEPQSFKLRVHHVALAAAAHLAACGLATYLLTTSVDPEPSAPDPSSPPPVATLIHNTGDLRTPHGYPAEGDDYGRGEYTLSTGTAEFMLTNAVNVKLRGETRLHMHNDMNVALTHGSAEFVCPTDAKGFTVHMPDQSKIVDLGTRFRVVTDAAGRVLVHVLEGRVDWKRPDGSIRTFDQGQGVVTDAQTFDTWNPNLIFSDAFEHAADGDARLHRQRGALAPADWKSRIHGSGDGTLDVTDGRLVLTAVPDQSNVESNAVLDRPWEAASQRVVIEYTVTSDTVGFHHDFKIDPVDASRNPASGVTIGARVYPSHVALFIGSQPMKNIKLDEPAHRMRWVLDATDPPAKAAGLLTLIVNDRELLVDIPYHSEDAQRRVALAVPQSPTSGADSVAFDDFKISIEPQDKDDATE